MASDAASATASILDFDVFDLANRVFAAFPEPTQLADFGPYRIEGRIDQGGMGEVWRAFDPSARRTVAIKIPRYVFDARLRERFVREVYNLGKLEHRFIARLYDHGICPDGTPYLAMEFVQGKPIDEYCRERQLSIEARMRLFQDVCEAVQYAHSRLVVHRDLKPSNILVTEDGTPKLLDFGIAKQLESLDEEAGQTRTDLRFTRAYASPEQIRNEPVGTHMDVYALGVILYELLAGKPPYAFDHCTPGQAELIVTSDQEPEKPSAAESRVTASKAAWNDLDLLCLKALKKDVSRRYASVIELAQDVEHYLLGEPLRARPDTFRYRLGKFIRRNRESIAVAASIVTLIIGLTLFFTLRLKKERDNSNRQTAIVTAMNRFLSEDLLGRTDPFKSAKAEESFADVVGRAASQIDIQFRSEPLVAARLHEALARAFDSRADYPQARREYQRSDELFHLQEGWLSQDAVAVELFWAQSDARSYQPGSLERAKSLLSGAQKTLARIAHPRQDLAVRVLQTRGIVALMENDAGTANTNFSAALAVAGSISSLDAIEQNRLRQLVAFSYMRLGKGASAEPLFRDVVASYSKAYGAGSPEVLRARVNLAQTFLAEHKYAAAIDEINQIYPSLLEKLGQNHEVTMAVLGARAASEGSLGRWDDAIRDDLAMHRLAAEKGGPQSYLGIASLSDASLSQCEAGRFADGESNARTAHEQAKKGFGARNGLTGATAYALAVCLIGRNKLIEASALLENIDVSAVAQLAADPAVGADIQLAQADIAARQGNYQLAKSLVDKAAPAFDRPDADFGAKQTLERLRKTLAAKH